MPAITLRELRQPKILELLETSEDDISLEKVSVGEFRKWTLDNPELADHKLIRYEYNFLTERLIVKCMSTATHDSLQTFFNQTFSAFLVGKLGLLGANQLFTVSSGTSFVGFDGDFSGSSEKIPDAFVMLKDSKLPAIVCEAGWTESWDQLMEDTRLWLLCTGGITKIVIVLSFVETKPVTGAGSGGETPGGSGGATGDGSEDGTAAGSGGGTPSRSENATADESENETNVGSESGTGCGSENTTADESESEATAGLEKETTGGTEEEKVIDMIDESTRHQDLTLILQRLDQESKLGKPLIGELKATLHVYRATEDLKGIVPLFSTTVLPLPPHDYTGPREFEIALRDIFGDDVPESMNPQDHITFSLPVLEALVSGSLKHTSWYRANKLAKKLMREAGVWEEDETFAQSKRRRLD